MLQAHSNLSDNKSMPVKDKEDRMQLIIGKELKGKLFKQAAKEDLTASQLIRRILNEYLKKKN